MAFKRLLTCSLNNTFWIWFLTVCLLICNAEDISSVLSPSASIVSISCSRRVRLPRALGGFLLLIAVPILQIARWHESPWRLVVVVIVYLWIIYGLVLLLSPWYFRKMYTPLLENETRFKAAAYAKSALGILLLLLGLFVY